MALDIEEMQRKFDEYYNSPEFEADLEKLTIKNNMKNLEHQTYSPSVLRTIKFCLGVAFTGLVIIGGLVALSGICYGVIMDITNAIK
jgi:hypothetical protein